MLLNCSRRTEFVEGTLGHARENRNHRIGTLLLIHVAELDHVCAVSQEGTAKERVDEEYVAYLKQKQKNNNNIKKLKNIHCHQSRKLIILLFIARLSSQISL